MKRDLLKEDIIISTMLFIASTVIYLLIRFGDLHAMTHRTTGLAPAFFPELAFSLMILLSFILLISTLIKRYKQNIKTRMTEKLDRDQTRQVITVSLILLVYIHMIGVVGYYVSSLFTLITIMLIFRVRKWYKILLPPLVLMVVVFLFFEKGLKIFLPRGFLF